jgi:hypothetical protein
MEDGMIDCLQGAGISRENLCVAQMQLFSAVQVAAMRDRTRLRGHATGEFRREQLLRREFGLQRRYAHKAIRRYGSVRAAAAAIRARVEELVPSPSIESGRSGQSVLIAAAPATAAAERPEAEVVDVAWAELEPPSAEPPSAEPPSAEPPSAEPPSAEPVRAESVRAAPFSAAQLGTEPVATELARAELAKVRPVAAEPPSAEPLGTELVVVELVGAEPIAAELVNAGPQACEVGAAEPRPARPPAVSQPVPLAPNGRGQSRPGRGLIRSPMRPTTRRAVGHRRQRRRDGFRHGERGQIARGKHRPGKSRSSHDQPGKTPSIHLAIVKRSA